jgi:hypothetical protein
MFERAFRFYANDLQMFYPAVLAKEICNVDEEDNPIIPLKKNK